ncbi:outer membrane lipoprotein-sorting protein [Marichromatium bheemlicum]|uniref:Outer membrane lipoprotein-sorting protein n=1 Tax=Marichromatium bheemlicum TaxID=365339 RepID=A0ABX1I7Z4_9GAMM|nr:outer membrane lipoprotein-sorting protein [Marichromatium bheemlicum]NKN33286.1 outer membrane lipoprotein-sorting protein [Marichromatium bheemlicum]
MPSAQLLSRLLAGALALTAATTLAAPTGEEIMTRVDQRPDGEDRRSTMVMELINSNGSTRVRRMLVLSKDDGPDTRKVMALQSPPDVKGTAFLTWEYDDIARDDDRWLYLPALKRVRRIMGESRNDAFMGSDFTYDDLGDRSVEEDTHTLIGEERLDGHDCWVVESVPRGDDELYVRKQVWVRQDADLPIKVEFYDHRGLLKVLRVLEARQQDGFWVQFRTEMHNVQQDHRTLMTIEEIAHDTGLRDALFEVSAIQRGHLR